MDIDTATNAVTETIEEYPSNTKTVLIAVAATAVTMIGARLVLNRHFKKATETVVETTETTPIPETVNA